MIPGPGTACAFVRCAQDEILWTPREYCRVTVLPESFELTKPRATSVPDEHTYIGKFTILEDEKIVLLTQSLELDDEIMVKVLYDVNVRLVNIGLFNWCR
jgi:hypothetical protein